MKITFGPNANQSYVSPYALSVLESILTTAKLDSCLITSTARTPHDQARIMCENIIARGVAHQKALYAAAGDAVIDEYVKARDAGKGKSEIIAAMEAKIITIGPAKVSHHCADPKRLVVMDVAPSSIKDKAAFEKAVRNEKRVSKFLVPPADPAYHLEIIQPS